ncbi:major facilitator superfamily domain-containing protein [Cadophora sp. MPI-SDFR-AT-0126]|nr:major facilitator superfamily domain-containing protein [Leotiomycetes sp. MPI-SDFR-AT-0126]
MLMAIDSSFAAATYTRIGSSFNQLDGSQWALIMYSIGLISSQPLITQLSLIVGSRAVLLFCYCAFAVGNLWSGLSVNFTCFVIGRAITAVGSAGMNTLVQVILKDSVPARLFTICLGVIEITDASGMFLGSGLLPLIAKGRYLQYLNLLLATLAIVSLISAYSLRSPAEAVADMGGPHRVQIANGDRISDDQNHASYRSIAFSIMKQVDSAALFLLPFISAVFARLSSDAFLTGPHLQIWTAASLLVCLVAVFCWAEFRVVSFPIVPRYFLTMKLPRIILITQGLGMMAISSVLYIMPFEAELSPSKSRNSNSGTVLTASYIGGPIGSLIGGFVIKRSGQYKLCILCGIFGCSVMFICHAFTWNAIDSVPSHVAIFIQGAFSDLFCSPLVFALISSMTGKDRTRIMGVYFLLESLASLFAVSISSAVVISSVTGCLRKEFGNMSENREIVQKALENMDFLWTLPQEKRDLVLRCFEHGMKRGYLVSLCLALGAFCFALQVKQLPADEEEHQTIT